MPDAVTVLEERLGAAFDAVSGFTGTDPVLRPSERADFQANGALALAKRLDRPPRPLAEAVATAAQLDGVCTVEVSGPGFLNLTLDATFVVDQLAAMAADDRLGLVPAAEPRRVVVDYSAPNVAKELAVHHIRSTVIGDALCRLYDALGHDVRRENHVGDWGTPFGMLIEHLLDLGVAGDGREVTVADLDEFYQQARQAFDADEGFRERARRRVVLLQSGDPETMALWRAYVAESERHFAAVYATLGVLLTDDDIVGESFYNPMLPAVVDDLRAAGLLEEDDGALCVFPPGFTNRENQPLPLIVRKSDGGFGYAATDLAAIRDRVDRVGATRILYVVGAPQAQHLAMCTAVARLAGWLPPDVPAVHVAFGNVLGPDRKMFRTRSGGTVKLADLLAEAVQRAEAAVVERHPDLDPATRTAVARQLGIGAVKWADLSTERTRDYVFDWDRMLAAEGDTAPYVQYAHARVRSIFAKRGDAVPALPQAWEPDPAERALMVALLGYNQVVQSCVELDSPSKLTTYLFELASLFSTFYEHCPVLAAGDAEVVARRLWLCDLVARVLAAGLGLLGIGAPDRM